MKTVVKFLPGLIAAVFFSQTSFAGFYFTPALPVINTNNVVNILTFGAVGDGVVTNTLAISNAISAAASGGTTNGAAGGTVEIPPGIYLCGPIILKSSVNLQVDAGAILRMLPLSAYPGGTNTGTTFISGSSLHDIELSGPGAIDGQGAAWWPFPNMPRPRMFSPSSCNRVLINNITLSNSPMFHIAISGTHSGNTTVQNVIIRAPGNSPNTDACDVAGTNILVQNCDISEGDDDFTCGGDTSGVLLTNNTYGTGHGISIGSFTDNGGVSNITVVNCTMNGPVNGIRIKSDNDRGGLVHDIHYINIGITNCNFPIQIYGYYNLIGTPSSISPYFASTQAVATVTSLTPAFRDITFSNITATSLSGFPVGIIWARKEMPATNIIFNKIKVTGNRTFCLYNVSGAQFIDSTINVSANTNTFALYNAQVIVSNSAPSNTLFSFNGLATNGVGNAFTLYNALGSLSNTNVLTAGPVLLNASTLRVSNNLALYPGSAISYALGTNTAQIVVKGNLALGGTNFITAGSGFTNGTYTLMTYTGALSGSPPVLGSVPAGFNYAIDTSTAGQVNLIVSQLAPSILAPTNLIATATNLLVNLTWNAVAGANTYNLKRGTSNGGPYPTIFSGLTSTNYADTTVTNAVTYYYVVSAVGTGGESSNSSQVGVVPLPSNQPTNLVMQVGGGQLQLSWPQDHLGWRLQIQTNDLAAGLGNDWSTVANSTNVNSVNLPIVPTNTGVFLRMVYP